LGDELQRGFEAVRRRVREPPVGELGHRPRRLLPLEQVEADVDLAGDLDAGEADLAVAHRRVHVADREHAPGAAHGEVDLGALAGDRGGGAVDPPEVDLGNELVPAPDLAGEAVVRLERDRVAGLHRQNRLELGPEGPDDLVAGDPVHQAGSTTGGIAATVSSSTYTRSTSRSRSGAKRTTTNVSTTPRAAHAIATQFAYLIG